MGVVANHAFTVRAFQRLTDASLPMAAAVRARNFNADSPTDEEKTHGNRR